jgi:HPt (histidine-containing phosphotransfer) domain-containing protein
MSDYYLRSEITKKLGPSLRPFADKAFDVFKKANPGASLDYESFYLIQSIAVELEAFAKEIEKKKKAQLKPDFEYSADNLIRSEKALEQIQPEIEALRLELFGKITPPFKSYDAALAWLKKEEKAEAASFFKKTGDQAARIKEIDNDIFRLETERNDLGESLLTINIDFAVPFLSRFRTYPGTKLRKAASHISLLARLWHFRENSLAAYFLVEIKPIQKLIDLTFYGPVNVRDLISFYRKRAPSFKRPKKISAKSLSVVEFIRGMGGVPKKNKMLFWKSAWKEWNKTHREKRYTSLGVIKKAHERTLKRMSH